MARRLITAALRAVVKIFFRRIEIEGDVPADAPVIFAVNHPNALIDPLFLLCFAPRRVSFLAKAPLFRMPVIGWITRAFDSIPVYRRQDAGVTGTNEETFGRARAILGSGGAIAIFPEGTTHSDPRLRELKTGAARIALGASIRVLIVPTGLYYTSKHTFRSSALVYFGEPIVVEPSAPAAGGEPPSNAVDDLTRRIEDALAAVTLQADSHEALELIARAERVFSAERSRTLAEELELRKRFVDGYRYLCAHDPRRLARLEAAVSNLDVAPRGRALRPIEFLLIPFGAIGVVIHAPIYWLIDVIARRAERETAATVKVLAALVFYPLLWIAIAFFTRAYALVILPILGYCAIVALEVIEELRASRPDVAAIRDEIVRVADEITARSDRGAGSPEAASRSSLPR